MNERTEAGPGPATHRPALPRRLQKMGTVTLGVSLPRAWVGARGLAPGHPVYLRPMPDGSLLLRDSDRDRRRDDASVTIDVAPSAPGEHLFRRLIGAYLAGATEFVVREPTGLSPQTRSVARSFARRTGQTERVVEMGTMLLLRDVSLDTALPVPRLLQRMFQLVYDQHVEAGRSWTRGPAAPPASLAARDDEVDRCAWQIERLLGRTAIDPSPRSGPEIGEAFRCLLWARDLERVGDHAVLIGEHGTRLGEATPPDPLRRLLSTYHAQALDHLSAAHAVAAAPDAERANQLLDVGEALQEMRATLSDRLVHRDSVEHLPAPAVRSLGLVLQSIDRTTGYAQNLAEIGLDRDLQRAIRRTEPWPERILVPA